MKGTCSICGMVIRSHASAKNSAKANFLKAMRKHQWKNHRNTMISRIKAGKRVSENNPTIQDFITALQGAPQRAIAIYEDLRAKDWIQLKRVLDAMEPIMPVEMRATWKAIEAFHDTRSR
jgi:superfamily I DNA and RNA helicase